MPDEEFRVSRRDILRLALGLWVVTVCLVVASLMTATRNRSSAAIERATQRATVIEGPAAPSTPQPEAPASAEVATLPRGDSPLHCLVQDSGQRAIDGAQVMLLSSSGEILESATSDSAGEAVLQRVGGDGAEVVARAKTYAMCREYDPRQGSAVGSASTQAPKLLLTLYPGLAVQGRVIAPDGSSVERAAIILWRCCDPPPAAPVLARPDSSLIHAVSEADGTFEIPDLDPGVPHFVVAAGAGLLCAERVRIVPIQYQARPLVMTVSYAYGIGVVFRETGGKPIRAGPALWGVPWPTLNLPATLSTIDAHSTQVRLARLDIPAELDRNIGDRLFFLCAGSVASKRIGDIPLHAALPGYRPLRAEVAAYRFDSSPYRMQYIECIPVSASGFGRLEIVARRTDPSTLEDSPDRRPGQQTPFASVRLYADPAVREGPAYLEFLLHNASLVPLEVDGVPCGDYRVVVSNPVLPAREPLRVTITPDETARLEFETPRLGRLTVTLDVCQPGRAPRAYRGPAIITIAYAAGFRHSRDHGFRSSPYVVGGLPEGTFRVSAVVDGFVSEFEDLRVEGGSDTHAAFALRLASE